MNDITCFFLAHHLYIPFAPLDSSGAVWAGEVQEYVSCISMRVYTDNVHKWWFILIFIYINIYVYMIIYVYNIHLLWLCVCLCRCLCLDTASRCSLLSVSLLILTSTPQHSIAFAHSFSLRLGLVSFAVSLFFSQCLLNLPCVCVWVLRCLRRVCVRVCVCTHDPLERWNVKLFFSFGVWVCQQRRLGLSCPYRSEGEAFSMAASVSTSPWAPWACRAPKQPCWTYGKIHDTPAPHYT